MKDLTIQEAYRIARTVHPGDMTIPQAYRIARAQPVSRPLRYRSRAAAESVAFGTRGMAIVLGDDGYHWVVTCAEAQRLGREGYSVAYLPGR
jgi:hypothetical protein